MKPWVVISLIVVFLSGCSGGIADRGQGDAAQKPTPGSPGSLQPDQTSSTSTGDANFKELIVGKWEMADGSDLVVEFARDGEMRLTNKAGKRQISLKDDKDFSYKFISQREVEAHPFEFSVEIASDKLTIRGKGPTTILLSGGGNRGIMFPPAGKETLEFRRSEVHPQVPVVTPSLRP